MFVRGQLMCAACHGAPPEAPATPVLCVLSAELGAAAQSSWSNQGSGNQNIAEETKPNLSPPPILQHLFGT